MIQFPRIIKVTIVNTGKEYEIGKDSVTEIKDNTSQFENSITTMIFVMRGERVWIEIIDTPIILERDK